MGVSFTEVATIQAPTRSATTGQYSVSYADDETDAQVRFVPLRGRAILTNLGAIPAETSECFVAGHHTIAPGYRIVYNSITYEVMSVETYGPKDVPSHHVCIVKRLVDV